MFGCFLKILVFTVIKTNKQAFNEVQCYDNLNKFYYLFRSENG